ncbi:aldose epimerase [Trichocoleus desertorum AS-A10]|uniref:aldose epimerase family protein n=1 Tax=Trichocoleus desertorum TaxID=1481672 RepID=UPI00329A029C
MFAIATEQRQYKTYLLSDQATNSHLEIVPERGGIVTSWQVQGQELLYLDAERFANPELTVRGGIPILFPICGNLPNNTYNHNGQNYTLKQHGFARDLPWQVTEQETQDLASLTLALESNEQTLAAYPFQFQVAFTYKLQGHTLEIHQRFENRSSEPMPFSIGLHPYFVTSDKTQLQFDIPATDLLDQRSQAVESFSNQFDFERDEIDVAFRELSRRSATASDRGQGVHLTLSYESPYSTVVFWTVKGKEFYCLEPWTAGRNALNTGDRLTHLAPGASLDTTVQLTAKFL